MLESFAGFFLVFQGQSHKEMKIIAIGKEIDQPLYTSKSLRSSNGLTDDLGGMEGHGCGLCKEAKPAKLVGAVVEGKFKANSVTLL